MGLSVTFVSGPRSSGKSTIIRAMIDRIWDAEPHYIRLVESGSGKIPPKVSPNRIPPCAVATAKWLEYRGDSVFEVLPELLTKIYKKDRYGSVVLEADADPALRHAYPYDHRLFVMPLPTRIESVFREARRAAEEFHRVLDDTAAFASEIFGLFKDSKQEDVDPPEDRPELTDTQMRGFLHSPLGDELATRIQLKQAYHGLVESDVILVNAGVGEPGPQTAECLRRIERLLERVRGESGQRGEMFLCDPRNQNGKVVKRLFAALEPMCQRGK